MKKFIKYPKSKITSASQWGENSITMWQEEDMLKYLDEEEPEVDYDEVYDAFIGHTKSLMSGTENYFIASTKYLAKETIDRFKDFVYSERTLDYYDEEWGKFERWLRRNGVIDLINEENEFMIIEKDNIIIDTRTGKAYTLNIVAEYVERF